jgi:hypothetical protein
MSVPREYLQLDSGSEYEREGKAEIFLREGKQNEALQELKALPATVDNGGQMLEPCLQHRPRTKAEAVAVQQLHSGVMAQDDPLPKYLLAGWDSLCDQPDLAFRELHRAIEQNYCAYPQKLSGEKFRMGHSAAMSVVVSTAAGKLASYRAFCDVSAGGKLFGSSTSSTPAAPSREYTVSHRTRPIGKSSLFTKPTMDV